MVSSIISFYFLIQLKSLSHLHRHSWIVTSKADGIKFAFFHASSTFNTYFLIYYMHLFLFTTTCMCRRCPLTSKTSYARSEERRVGKECRSRWSREHEKIIRSE